MALSQLYEIHIHVLQVRKLRHMAVKCLAYSSRVNIYARHVRAERKELWSGRFTHLNTSTGWNLPLPYMPFALPLNSTSPSPPNQI